MHFHFEHHCSVVFWLFCFFFAQICSSSSVVHICVGYLLQSVLTVNEPVSWNDPHVHILINNVTCLNHIHQEQQIARGKLLCCEDNYLWTALSCLLLEGDKGLALLLLQALPVCMNSALRLHSLAEVAWARIGHGYDLRPQTKVTQI